MKNKNYLAIFVSILSVTSILITLAACKNTSPLVNEEDGPAGIAFDSDEIISTDDNDSEQSTDDPITTLLKSTNPVDTYNNYIAQNNSIFVNEYKKDPENSNCIFLKKNDNNIIQIGSTNSDENCGLVSEIAENNVAQLFIEHGGIDKSSFLTCVVQDNSFRISYTMSQEEYRNYVSSILNYWNTGYNDENNKFKSSDQNGNEIIAEFQEETSVTVITITKSTI